MNQLILLNLKAFSGKIRTKLDKYFGKTIREVLLEEGVLSRVVAEVAKGFQTTLVESKAPKTNAELQKEAEGKLILDKLLPTDRLILLDENGKEMNSIEFSSFLQKQMNSGIKQLVLVIGGPYGFSEAVYKKASGTLALSKMTFSHQMVRLFVIEQLYRGFTILKNEPYHHR